MSDHRIRDLGKLEARSRGWCRLDWWDARNLRQKGNSPGHAGYRQRGRAEMRAAKRKKARMDRRIGQMLCENPAD